MSQGKSPPRQADQGFACGYGDTLRGNHCELPGEIWSGGLMLCEKHAAQIEAQDRIVLLRGFVACVELCLSNITIRRNTALVRLLQAERKTALAEMEAARSDLRRAIA